MVYQLPTHVDRDIRHSFTGGAADVYITKNHNNETLYCYDVNALYPSSMLNNPMPVGKGKAFQGDITKIKPDAFGFFYCNIKSPEYLEHPILQRNIKTVKGLRTIAGLGSWTGWYFSEEIYNAIKYGYKFEILHGYEYDKANIFSGYINEMYNLRLNYPKGDPMNDSAKLLNNSLYGKFGMKNEITKIEILDTTNENNINKINKILDKLNTNIQDIINLDNYIVIIHNKFIPNDNNKDLFLDDSPIYQMNTNIAIASAITAYARIFMSQFKIILSIIYIIQILIQLLLILNYLLNL